MQGAIAEGCRERPPFHIYTIVLRGKEICLQQVDPQHVKYIYQETSTTPVHMAGFSIFDQSTVPGGRLGHKNIINFFD